MNKNNQLEKLSITKLDLTRSFWITYKYAFRSIMKSKLTIGFFIFMLLLWTFFTLLNTSNNTFGSLKDTISFTTKVRITDYLESHPGISDAAHLQNVLSNINDSFIANTYQTIFSGSFLTQLTRNDGIGYPVFFFLILLMSNLAFFTKLKNGSILPLLAGKTTKSSLMWSGFLATLTVSLIFILFVQLFDIISYAAITQNISDSDLQSSIDSNISDVITVNSESSNVIPEDILKTLIGDKETYFRIANAELSNVVSAASGITHMLLSTLLLLLFGLLLQTLVFILLTAMSVTLTAGIIGGLVMFLAVIVMQILLGVDGIENIIVALKYVLFTNLYMDIKVWIYSETTNLEAGFNLRETFEEKGFDFNLSLDDLKETNLYTSYFKGTFFDTFSSSVIKNKFTGEYYVNMPGALGMIFGLTVGGLGLNDFIHRRRDWK